MAAGDSLRCIRNAPFRAIIDIRDTANSLVSGATNLDTELIADSGTPADLTGEATEIGSSGIYYVDLTASEMTATGDISIITKSTEGNTTFYQLPVEPHMESGVAQAGTANSITLRSAASATNDLYNGCQIEIVRGTGVGQSRTISDYVGSTNIASVDRSWTTNPDTTSVYAISGVGAAMGTNNNGRVAANILEVNSTAAIASAIEHAYQGGFIQSSVDDASPTTTGFTGASGLSSTDDFYNTSIMLFVTGNLAGIAREITDYTGSTLTFTTGAFPVAPANGDEFMITGKVF